MFYQDNHVTLYNKSCHDMSELADNSIQCVVTSPPYWGLRKYKGNQDLIWGGNDHHEHEWVDNVTSGEIYDTKSGGNGSAKRTTGNVQKVSYNQPFCSVCGAWRGAFGLEPTLELYVQHSIEILREIRRVLKPDGVCFWNVGDSYNGSGYKDVQVNSPKQMTNRGATEQRGTHVPGLKPKDLCLIPFRVALAAQQDGWWVRSDIIWNKSNPMPESVRDRPTDAFEHILMLTKSARYYWDMEAVREVYQGAVNHNPRDKASEKYGGTDLFSNGGRDYYSNGGRNLRNVWTFPTHPYKDAHFATFPEELPERCIKAATSEKGCCPKCGKPWERILEKAEANHDGQTTGGKDSNSNRIALLRQATRERGGEYVNETTTLGWRPSCECDAGEPVPCTVLDPFAGSGTTLWVAKKMGRKSVGYELPEEYCQLIINRNRQQALIEKGITPNNTISNVNQENRELK